METPQYRDYLQGLASGGDNGAYALLQLAGNDYKIDQNAYSDPNLIYSFYNPVNSENWRGNIGQLDQLNSMYTEQYGNDYLNPDPIYSSGNVLGSAATSTQPSYDWQTGLNTINNSANSATATSGLGLKQGITDYFDSARQAQSGIDQQGVQNEMSLQEGQGHVLGMVSRGIRSGGTMLANRNASDSSATGAIARAYGDIGRRNMSSIGNQYAMNDYGLQQQQGVLNQAIGKKKGWVDQEKTKVVNNIVGSARNELQQLYNNMAEAGITGQLDIEAEANKIKQRAMTELQAYDTYTSQASGMKPTTQPQRAGTAAGLMRAGTAPTDSFQYQTSAPLQVQDTGPWASELPLFTLPRNKRSK